MRAVAIENGLDPDRTLPEDILLLVKDDKGTLKILAECEEARKRAIYHNSARVEEHG